jgi:hypothetical protein
MSTMVMADSFTQMATIISATGLMERDQDMASWLIGLEEFMKGSGSFLSLWAINDLIINLSIIKLLIILL